MTSMISTKKALIAKDTVLVNLAIIAFVRFFDFLVFVYSGCTATVVHDLNLLFPFEYGIIC